RVMGLLDVGEDGLIHSLRVFWGRSDVSPGVGPVPDESRRKGLAVEHCRLINEGDVDGLLRLYSPRIRFEDPVGAWTRNGREALRAHATMAVGSHAHEATGTAVAAQDGRHAALEVRGTLDYLPAGPQLVQFGLARLPEPAEPAAARVVI